MPPNSTAGPRSCQRETATAQIDVGAELEFEEGKPHVVDVGGREVGLIRWAGTFYALRMVCPHQLGPVQRGVVRLHITCPQTVGKPEADESTPVITCPWHGWEFYLHTGRPIWDPDGPRLRVYEVEVVAGRVLIKSP